MTPKDERNMYEVYNDYKFPEELYSCTLSSTSELDEGGWSAPRPVHFNPEKWPSLILYGRTGRSLGRSEQMQIISPSHRDTINGPSSPYRVAIPTEPTRPNYKRLWCNKFVYFNMNLFVLFPLWIIREWLRKCLKYTDRRFFLCGPTGSFRQVWATQFCRGAQLTTDQFPLLSTCQNPYTTIFMFVPYINVGYNNLLSNRCTNI